MSEFLKLIPGSLTRPFCLLGAIVALLSGSRDGKAHEASLPEAKGSITVAELTANPARYHNRNVRVRGYLVVGAEESALYFDEKAYRAFEPFDWKGGIWISGGGKWIDSGAFKVPGYVVVRGIFVSARLRAGLLVSGSSPDEVLGFGHNNSWMYEISDISEISRYEE